MAQHMLETTPASTMVMHSGTRAPCVLTCCRNGTFALTPMSAWRSDCTYVCCISIHTAPRLGAQQHIDLWATTHHIKFFATMTLYHYQCSQCTQCRHQDRFDILEQHAGRRAPYCQCPACVRANGSIMSIMMNILIYNAMYTLLSSD